MDRRLKKCSTSTDVESVRDVSEVTNPLQKAKRELDNVEIKEKRKKQKKQNETSEKKKRVEKPCENEKSDEKKEIKKLRNAYEKLTETFEKLHEIIRTRPNLPDISFTPPKEKVGPIYHNVCNFDDKDHLGLSDDALFVQGFDTSPPRHEIKTALWNHFSSCGKVYQIYVPIACSTGASLGYAFIDMKDEAKGLTLSGSHLGGQKLHVMMARYRSEFGCSSNLIGCQRCRTYKPWLVERALSKARFAKHWRRKPQTVGTPYSKIGRFTAIIGRGR